MKKVFIITLLVALFSTTVFAIPSTTGSEFTFDVDGIELTGENAENIKGEGFAGAVGGAILGAAAKGFVKACYVACNSKSYTAKSAAQAIGDAMWKGAVSGAITRALVPTP